MIGCLAEMKASRPISNHKLNVNLLNKGTCGKPAKFVHAIATVRLHFGIYPHISSVHIYTYLCSRHEFFLYKCIDY